MDDRISALHDIVTARSVEDVWAHHTSAMKVYGFDRLMFGHTRFLSKTGFMDREDLMVLSSFPEDYSKGFIDQGLFEQSPMLQWAVENTGAMSWSWIAENMDSFTDGTLKVIDFNQKHSVHAGYTISFQETDARHKGAIALAGRPGLTQSDLDETWIEYGTEIQVMNEVAYLKLISLPFDGRKRRLTARQREVLEWVSDGKTTADIATILSVSPAAVEKHMRLARQSLGVETTAQAILKASIQHQIFRMDQK